MSARNKLTTALGVAVALVAAAFCFLFVPGMRRPVGTPEYVALGSSYASGPGLPPRSVGSPILCARSANNYPHIVAKERSLALVDVTCAGATTEHVLKGGQHFQAAQLDAITPQTRLVTITIGGNDVLYLHDLVSRSCGPFPSRLSRLLGFCTSATSQAVEAGFSRLTANLEMIVQQAHNRSPQARVMFINYLTVLPTAGTCARLGLSTIDADKMRAVAARLVETTKEAARATGADLVDVAALSRDHNVCAAIPWLNDRHPASLLTAPLHPNALGMRAVADAIDRALLARDN